MRLATNMTAIVSAGYLSSSEKSVRQSLERLSSGYKINHSKDDAAGMAISEKMRTQIKGLDRASMNASDGISVIETAEGGMAEIHLMLQRMNELAVEGANDTFTQEDRDNIAKEVEALKQEINRISSDTQFNSTNLLDGDLQRRVYATVDNGGNTTLADGIRASYISNAVEAGNYKITMSGGVASLPADSGFSSSAILTQVENKVKVVDANGVEMNFTVDMDNLPSGDITFEVWDIGTMPIQVGANEGQIMDICVPEVSVEALNLDLLDCSSSDACSKSLTIIADAISRVSQFRAQMGAYENRLECSVRSLDGTAENMTAALSRIQDVDMAKEMTNYTQYNVMQQAGVSMVSQANQLPEKVLQLLQ